MLRFLLILVLAVIAFAQTPQRWDGMITISEMQIPIRLMLSGEPSAMEARFANGNNQSAPLKGQLRGKQLELSGEGAKLSLTLDTDTLEGTYSARRISNAKLTASKYCACAYEGEAGPDISGDWTFPDGFQLRIRRQGEDTLATLLHSGSELGPLAGRFDGASFILNFFDGNRAAIVELTPAKDGSLDAVLKQPGATPIKQKAVALKR
jgi:hypothetical protein